jgi:regulator of PEP synthase PpsR (kinase-PPPase family)
MTNVNKRFIFLVSDASGFTVERVARAALDQFSSTEIITETFNFVRSTGQINHIMKKSIQVDGIIVYTFVSPEMRAKITELGRFNGVPTVDIMGPLLTRMSDLLEISPFAKPGLKNQLDQDYFDRIEAIDFTIKHDDGLGLSTINQAEIILIGVSRTTKTPASIYLSYRGWKVANIPILTEHGIPQEIIDADRAKIIGLSIKPTRLSVIRMERQRKLLNANLGDYTDPDSIKFEVNDALKLYRKYNIPVINVTNKSIEETSTEIMRIIYQQTNLKKGKITQ